jgi:hypothetical protein
MSNRIREALQFIPASDRDTWVKMGMAIKSEVGDAGFALWEGWSLPNGALEIARVTEESERAGLRALAARMSKCDGHE